MVTAIVLLSVVLVSGVHYRRPCDDSSALFITAPQTMEALNGSCLHIPCHYRVKKEWIFNITSSPIGVWLKQNTNFAYNRHNVIYNSSNTSNIYPMSLIGDLTQHDCTTLFSNITHRHTDRYYFRLENRPYSVATAICEYIDIQATDQPRSPSIELSSRLREEQCVNITCLAFTPCPHSPPNLTWTLQQNPHNEIVENKDRTFTTKIQTTIIVSDKHDGLIITCSARYPVNEGKDVRTAEQRTTLSVSYAPKDTSVSISPSGLLSAGSLVNLTCSSRANPVSRFTWFKANKSGPVSVSEGYFYSFKVTSVTDIDDYYCVATNYLGSQTSPRSNKAGTESPVSLLQLLQWGPALGGTLVIILICLTISVWWFKSKRPQTQTQRGDELTFQRPALHDEQIDFSMQTPAPSLASEQDSGQQQDTLYAQVNVSESESMANVSESASMADVSESASMANVSESASS